MTHIGVAWFQKGGLEMEVLKMVEIEERADDAALGVTTFRVDPATAYPASLEELAARAEAGKPPARFVSVGGEIRENPLARIYFPQAQQLGSRALRAAAKPEAPHTPERAAALELARLWFTESLHQAHNYRPMRVHITRDQRFKL